MLQISIDIPHSYLEGDFQGARPINFDLRQYLAYLVNPFSVGITWGIAFEIWLIIFSFIWKHKYVMKFITFCKLPLLHLLKVITMNTERRMKSFSKFLLDTPLGLKTCVKRKERIFWEKKVLRNNNSHKHSSFLLHLRFITIENRQLYRCWYAQ